MVLDCHPRGVKCRDVFVDRIKPHAVWLDELFDAIVAGDRPVEIECADVSLASSHRNSADCQPVAVRRVGNSVTESPLIRMNPRLDDQQAAHTNVISHVRDSGADIVESEQIPDAAGEARHNVEAAVQPKRPHVPEFEPNVWEFALSSLKHATTDVDTRNLDEVRAKVAKVTASTARDVSRSEVASEHRASVSRANSFTSAL